MDLSTKPIVAFFVFKSDRGVLMIRRGAYLGLPGDYLRDDESIVDCAIRSIKPIAMINLLDLHQFIGGSESHRWDDRPVAMNIFSFDREAIVAPMNYFGIYIDIERSDVNFDITIDIYRKLLETNSRCIAA